MKNKPKEKGLGSCLKWSSASLASGRPEVQSLVLKRKKKKRQHVIQFCLYEIYRIDKSTETEYGLAHRGYRNRK
jgi:hypothetical protein